MLERARRLGFLGPGEIDVHRAHASAMAAATPVTPRRFLDLGSGGGVPGLVLLQRWPEAEGALLDARERCVAFLREAVADLGFDDRATVVAGRAEELAHDPALRASFDLVVARSFAAPAVTAECAVGFLEPGGSLVVAEPPDARPDRWPAEGLSRLGLVLDDVVRADYGFARLHLPAPADPRWPRRNPSKRPLW